MRSPITSDDFASTFRVDDELFVAQSKLSPKLLFLANWSDLLTYPAVAFLVYVALSYPNNPRFSPEALYAVSVFWGTISTFRIIRRSVRLQESEIFEITRDELGQILAGARDTSAMSGLFVGWVKVVASPMFGKRSWMPVLSLERCVYLLKEGKILRVLARSPSDKLTEAVQELAKLGFVPVETSEERIAIIP